MEVLISLGCALVTIVGFTVLLALVLIGSFYVLRAGSGPHPLLERLGRAFRDTFGAAFERGSLVGSLDGHRVRLFRYQHRYSAPEMHVVVDAPTRNNILIVHPSVRDPIMIAVGVFKVVDIDLPQGFTALAHRPTDAKERLSTPETRRVLEALIALPGTSRVHLRPRGLGEAGARWEGRVVPELHEDQFVAAALKLLDLARAVGLQVAAEPRGIGRAGVP